MGAGQHRQDGLIGVLILNVLENGLTLPAFSSLLQVHPDRSDPIVVVVIDQLMLVEEDPQCLRLLSSTSSGAGGGRVARNWALLFLLLELVIFHRDGPPVDLLRTCRTSCCLQLPSCFRGW